MAKQNPNVTYQWCVPEKYVEGCIRQWFKVACRVKSNTNWTTKNTTSFHYFSKKFKTHTLQGRARYIKFFELEINNLHVQILAAKIT